MSEQIPPYGRPSGYQAGGDPHTPATARPWFKKKRFLIPLALVLLFIVAGIAGGSSDPKDDTVAIGASPTATAATAAPVQPTQDPAAAAERAAADKAAADMAAADKAVADKAAADKAAADKAAADQKAAADKAAADKQAADEKAAAEKAAAAEAAAKGTVSQQNAIRSARDYLRNAPFSRSALIKQLQFEKYSAADATFAVDKLDVDYNEQAVKSAAQYLKISGFSRDSLIQQLKFEGYTTAQATYGAQQNGL